MKDTRVETANEGMHIIMLFSTRTNNPIGCTNTCPRRISKNQTASQYNIPHNNLTERSDKEALASTLCIQMQICLQNRLYSFSRHGRIRRGRE